MCKFSVNFLHAECHFIFCFMGWWRLKRNAKFFTPLKQFGLMRRIILNRNMRLIIISGTFFSRGIVFMVIFCFLLCLFFTMEFSFLRLMLVAAVCCCVWLFAHVMFLCYGMNEDASGFISMGCISLKSLKCPANNNRVTFNMLSDLFTQNSEDDQEIQMNHNHKPQKKTRHHEEEPHNHHKTPGK